MFGNNGGLIVLTILQIVKETNSKLEPIPDEYKQTRLSLQQCLGNLTQTFFDLYEEILYSLPLREVDSEEMSSPAANILIQTLEKDRPVYVIKADTDLIEFKFNLANKPVENYVIQIRKRGEFQEHILEFRSDRNWNPHANFLVISTTIFNDTIELASEIIQEFWQIQVINCVVFLANSTNHTSYDAFAWYPYSDGNCGNDFRKTSLIDSCSFGSRDRPETKWFDNKVPKKLNECKIEVRMIDLPPYTINLENGSMGIGDKYFETKGLDGNLMNVVAERLNLRMHYMSSNISLNFGSVYDNGTYTGELAYLGNGEADAAIGGFAKTRFRNKYLDDSISYYRETLHWCVPHSPVNKNLDNLLNAISWRVWILIVTFYFVITILIWMCSAIGYEINNYKLLGSCFLNAYGLLLSTTVVLPKNQKTRFVVALLLLVSFYIITAYQTIMISVLSNKNYAEAIDSDEDVLYSGLKIYVIEDFKDFFADYDDDNVAMKMILKKWNDCAEIDKCLDLVGVVRDSIVSIPKSSQNFYLNTYVNTHNEPLIACFSQSMYSYPVNVLMRKGFPLFSLVNDLISRMISSGLFLKWERDINERHFQNITHYDIDIAGDINDNLDFFSLEPIFIMLLIGHAFALLAFVSESIYFKWFRK